MNREERKLYYITQVLVKRVLAMNRKSWHDKAYHNFMNHKSVQAIQLALQHRQKDDTLKDIVIEAKKYAAVDFSQ